MALGTTRIKTLYGVLAKLPGVHRYTAVRWGVGVAFTAAIAALPWTNTLRFDLWDGRHHVLGEQVGLTEAARAFAFPFLGVNIAIILVSRYFGRYLCGFVCPVGTLARLGEWARFKDRKGHSRWIAPLTMLGVSGLLSVITFTFWVDAHVFREGSPMAQVLSWTALGGMTLGLFGTVHFMGLRFCRDYCPSGVYFALLGQESANGVEFVEPESCTECGLCDAVCPMELKPRDMSGGAYRGSRGFYGEAMSNFANCIRCGDCIVACTEVGSARSEATALRMGQLPREHRDSRPPSAGASEGHD